MNRRAFIKSGALLLALCFCLKLVAQLQNATIQNGTIRSAGCVPNEWYINFNKLVDGQSISIQDFSNSVVGPFGHGTLFAGGPNGVASNYVAQPLYTADLLCGVGNISNPGSMWFFSSITNEDMYSFYPVGINNPAGYKMSMGCHFHYNQASNAPSGGDILTIRGQNGYFVNLAIQYYAGVNCQGAVMELNEVTTFPVPTYALQRESNYWVALYYDRSAVGATQYLNIYSREGTTLLTSATNTVSNVDLAEICNIGSQFQEYSPNSNGFGIHINNIKINGDGKWPLLP